jgi:hypothetical protein
MMRVTRFLPSTQTARPGEARNWRALAKVAASAFLIVASALGFSASVPGSEPLPARTISSVPAETIVRSQANESARHHCQCGTDCGGSCCCIRRGSGRANTIDDSGVLSRSTDETDGVFGQTVLGPIKHAHSGRQPSASSATNLDTGPCVNRFPCGGGTIPPSSSPLTRSLDSANISGRCFVTFHRAVERLTLVPAACLGQSASKPLDKPPRAMNGF